MAADMTQLIPRFQTKVQRLLKNCMQQGVEMRPYFTLRNPFDQAKFWRQSRSTEEIRAKIAEFHEKGAPFLAYCLDSVGPQHGDPVTNALPGFSWHQWGEAVDCFWVLNGSAEWSAAKLVNGINGYRVMAAEATTLQLTPGGLWSSLKDWPHIQLRPDGSPATKYSLQQIDAEMKRRFGQSNPA